MTPWLHIIGLGDDGAAGLSAASRAVLDCAETIIGGARHHALCPGGTAERLQWPSPFDALIKAIAARRGRRVAVLATGDPLWYSVGARIGKAIDPAEIIYHPQLSAFQMSACRMGWSLADLETVTLHGRPVEQIVSFLAPGARILALTKDRTTPGDVAALLCARGFGLSRITALAHLGGEAEARFDGLAEDWSAEVPDFHTLAIECVAAPGAAIFSRAPGLPDDAFDHDGKLTKREVRAATLAKLGPQRGALLWDVGAGSGAIGIEWMRAARDAECIALEPRADRRAVAAANALRLGAPRLNLIDAVAPQGFAGLPAPDAVFFGGGVTLRGIEAAFHALKPFGRLVANAVTLESIQTLVTAHQLMGGELTQISVARAEPVGPFRGWRALMPVTQWSLTK